VSEPRKPQQCLLALLFARMPWYYIGKSEVEPRPKCHGRPRLRLSKSLKNSIYFHREVVSHTIYCSSFKGKNIWRLPKVWPCYATGHCPPDPSKEWKPGVGVPFDNSITGNFAVYQDQI